MKWNLLVGSLVLGLGMSTQSFGFELLDRMLGGGDCGCESNCCESSCCEPKCCKVKCCKQKCCEPKCCEPKCCKVKCCKPKCCEPKCCEPKCCEPKCCKVKCCKEKCCKQSCDSCDSCCKRGLFDRIFAKKCCNSCGCDNGCDSGCDSGCSSCGAPVIHGDAGGDMGAPVPPAPVVDPQAFLPAPRRVATVSGSFAR